GPAAAAPARGLPHRRVGLCERVLRVATVPEPQGGRGGRGAHADAVPEWRGEPGTRNQQGGAAAHPGGRPRGGPGNGREVGAAAGLTQTPYQSGEGSREQGISKAGSRHIRAVAIETAWCWLRYQPQSRLSCWYQARFGRGGIRARKVGIVALARKLLIELWRFLECGVVPEGARLKTASRAVL